ncbi:MAG: radical SAM protein [Verrucomicrobiota bacterium]
MECEHEIPAASAAFFESLKARAHKERLPLSASFEVTTRCNLRCCHCYLGDPEGAHQRELNLAEACAVVDKIAGAGCLFLLFTGGEPLLQPDFAKIYRHAKECGLAVRVFTNGTLVEAEMVQLFQAYPPLEVEISLYGATPEMYQQVTGSERNYARCLAGIQRLLDGGVRVKLKTVLMRQNHAGLADMKALADRLGVPFRFDTAIFPTRAGDQRPLDCRLSPAAAAAAENEFRARSASSPDAPRQPQIPSTDLRNLLVCGAGRTTFAVDSTGNMTPCLLMRGPKYDLLRGTFAEGWRQMEPVCQIKVATDSPCQTCPDVAYCHGCAPIFEMETGNMAQPPAWLCDLARQRRATKMKQNDLL